MADRNDLPGGLLGPTGVNAHFDRGLRENSTVTLTPDQFNAAKHTSSSAIMSDIFGSFTAGVLGGAVEVVQDITEGYRGTGKVFDDHKDITNNYIGRAVQEAYPNFSAADYQKAAGLLAKAGILETNVNVNYKHAKDLYAVAKKKALAAISHLNDINFGNDVVGPQCFLEGTMIDMWPFDLKPDLNKIYNEQEILAKVWQKPIEEVTHQDWVLSYDDDGKLKPGRVTRTFQNHSKHILDLHGLMITPGHATYCARVDGEENRLADKHVPIIDILRSDGALKKNDGTLIRAATGCEIGSEDDEQFWALLLFEEADGTERVRDRCQLRYGTRWMLPNGNHFSMREYLEGIGVEIIKDGPHKGYARFKKTGVCSVFAWTLSESLPKPEDYVLQRSQVTLEEIYEADDWEAVGPQIPAPFMGEAGRSYKRDTGLYANAASEHIPPNIPHSMRNSPNQPTMSRKQRRAMEARQRKDGKQPKRAQTIH